MKESIEKVKETTESLTAKEEKLDDEINDTCDQLVIIIITIIMRGGLYNCNDHNHNRHDHW